MKSVLCTETADWLKSGFGARKSLAATVKTPWHVGLRCVGKSTHAQAPLSLIRYALVFDDSKAANYDDDKAVSTLSPLASNEDR
jgi:hypothetical protein